MTEKKQENVDKKLEEAAAAKQQKPNEQYGFYFSSALKITDKDTGKVLVQMRCD